MTLETPAWLQSALDNPTITDICLNGAEVAFADCGVGMEQLAVPSPSTSHCGWNNQTLQAWVVFQLSRVGRAWDARQPFVDATLESGHRLHVVFPPLVRAGIAVSLRRISRQFTAAEGGHANRWGGSPLIQPLLEATRRGDSILISGATGSGKTTLLSDLLASVPASERILALEDTPEIAPRHPHFLSLISRPPNSDGFGEVTLRTLLRQALRMRPDRIVLGECRGDEVLDLLQALNTGHRGSMATLHANSPRDALRRAELLCLLGAGGKIPPSTIRELLSVGIQWIAQVAKCNKTRGGRRITELVHIEGREGDTILLRPMILEINQP